MDISLLKDQPENLQLLTGCTKTEDKTEESEGGKLSWAEGRVELEPSTLPWSADRQTGAQAGKSKRLSVGSDLSHEACSWTESERELKAKGEKRGTEGNDEVPGQLGVERNSHLEKHDEDEIEENHLPEKAAQVFRHSVTVLHSTTENEAYWEMKNEKSAFLGSQQVNYNHDDYQYDWDKDAAPSKCECGPDRDALKMGVSLVTSAIFFPFLIWGGYVFLPFDAPLLQDAPHRLVYTLRCSVFAALPVVLGWVVLGVSRLRAGATRPLSDGNVGDVEHRDVTVHQRFVSDSASLFLIYFLQLVVMAMYLTQEQLKLIPLLTILFAFGRLVYWIAAAFGSSIRSFGFGLSFIPSLAMMVANFYFIFTVESSGSIFYVQPSADAAPPPSGKQRFFG